MVESYRYRHLVEILAVAIIFSMIAAAFFTFARETVEDSYRTVDMYNEQALKSAAMRYIVLRRFEPNINEDRFMLYLLTEDGQPSLEAAEGILIQDEHRKRYVGIRIDRIYTEEQGGHKGVTYAFTIVERDED